MADCPPQFQLMPQVIPIYRPQPPLTQPPPAMSQPPPPPPPPNAFPMPSGQPIFPMQPHFGYPPIAWSPVHQYPPPPPPPPLTPQQPAHDHTENDDDYDAQQLVFNNNNNDNNIINNNNYSSNKNINSADDSQIDLEFQSPQHQNRQTFSRNVSNKVNTSIGSGCVRGVMNFIFTYFFYNIYLGTAWQEP